MEPSTGVADWFCWSERAALVFEGRAFVVFGLHHTVQQAFSDISFAHEGAIRLVSGA
jgi:hypothetical protein